MKDHKRHKVSVGFYELEGLTIEGAISLLTNRSIGIIEPVIEMDYGYDGYEDLSIVGWVPLTEKEKEKEKANRKKERERKATAKLAAEEAEKAELRRLVEKYPGVV